VLVAEVAFTDAERRLGAHPTVGALVVRILLRHPVVRLRLRFERRRRLLAVTERVPLAVGPSRANSTANSSPGSGSSVNGPPSLVSIAR